MEVKIPSSWWGDIVGCHGIMGLFRRIYWFMSLERSQCPLVRRVFWPPFWKLTFTRLVRDNSINISLKSISHYTSKATHSQHFSQETDSIVPASLNRLPVGMRSVSTTIAVSGFCCFNKSHFFRWTVKAAPVVLSSLMQRKIGVSESTGAKNSYRSWVLEIQYD